MTMTTPRLVGPWAHERIERFFHEQAIPLRLSCRTASGWPLVASHWFLYRDGALWCATQSSASVVRRTSLGRSAISAIPPALSVTGP